MPFPTYGVPMATHAIYTFTERPDVKEALNNHYAGSVLYIDSRMAYLKTDDPAKVVYDKLNLSDGLGNVLVLGLSGDYWGRNPRANWDWLKRSFESGND